MSLQLAYLPSNFRFSGKYLFYEHGISAGQLLADSSATETLYCLNRTRTAKSFEIVEKKLVSISHTFSFTNIDTLKRMEHYLTFYTQIHEDE